MTAHAVKTLEHIAAGLRDSSYDLGNIETSQNAMPTSNAAGRVEYKPTGEFTLVLTYKRKDI